MNIELIECKIFSNTFIFVQGAIAIMFFASQCSGAAGDWTCGGAIGISSIVFLLPDRGISTHLHESAHTYMARMLGFTATYTINPAVTTIWGQQKPWQTSLIALAPLSLCMFGATFIYTALFLDIPFYLKVIGVFIGAFVWLAGVPSGEIANQNPPDWSVAILQGSRGINFAIVFTQSALPILLAALCARFI